MYTIKQKKWILAPESQAMVRRLANVYAEEFPYEDFAYESFLGAGEKGILTAAKKFNQNYDCSFQDYAFWHVVAEMELERKRLKEKQNE